ncbi:MAG: WG repeat-containing protein [Firmicutes bacterium]|nr:WG repeat-containing protein [Bacillota bacterium]
MKKLVRLTVIALTALLCASAFSACGGSGGSYMTGHDFSDGVAWVRDSVSSSTYSVGAWRCIDKKGKTKFKLDLKSFPASDFSDGAALVLRNYTETRPGLIGQDNTNAYSELVDKNGKTITPQKSDEYDDIFFTVAELKLFVVHKRINTLQTTEDQYGVIDRNGKWITPLHTNDALSNSMGFLHIGEGFIKMNRTTGGGYMEINSALFNVYTGETIKLDSTQVVDRLQLGKTSTGRFNDGRGVFLQYKEVSRVGLSYTSIYKGNVCSIDKDGKTTEIVQDVSCVIRTHDSSRLEWYATKAYLGNYNDGLFYFSDKVFKSDKVLERNDIMISGSNQGFYDIEGKQVIDLYYFVSDLIFFINQSR